VSGRFDPDQYKLALQSQNMTPVQFEELVRSDLIRQTVPSQLAASQFAGDAELEAYLSNQSADAGHPLPRKFPRAAAAAAPTDAELKAWYDAHASQYRSPEKVAIEYVEINAATLPVSTSPTRRACANAMNREVEIRRRRQRMASHILVQVDEKAPAAQDCRPLAKARDLAAKGRPARRGLRQRWLPPTPMTSVRRTPAATRSGREGVFGDEFDKVFMALQPGQVSDPVAPARRLARAAFSRTHSRYRQIVR